MKCGREHRVPLASAAWTSSSSMAAIRSGDFVFPGLDPSGRSHNKAMSMLLRRMGRGDLTVHGFQQFRGLGAERTNFRPRSREMAFAHAVCDKVEAAYRRGDLFEKRRQLAEAWAIYCTEPATEGHVIACAPQSERRSGAIVADLRAPSTAFAPYQDRSIKTQSRVLIALPTTGQPPRVRGL